MTKERDASASEPKVIGQVLSRGDRRHNWAKKRWLQLTQTTLDQLYAVFPDGSFHRRGPQGAKRRARKDEVKARTSHAGKLLEFGVPGRREGRQVYAKSTYSRDGVVIPNVHTEWRWNDSKEARG